MILFLTKSGGVAAKSVVRETFRQKVMGSISTRRQLPTGWFSVSTMYVTGWDRHHGLFDLFFV